MAHRNTNGNYILDKQKYTFPVMLCASAEIIWFNYLYYF